MDFIEGKEGKTAFFVPVQDPSHSFPPRSARVFYNPRMEISRDSTVLLASVLQPDSYLDAMGATGIRGLRIAAECGVPVTINDRDPEAVSLIRRNVDHSGLDIVVTESDVNVLLSQERFDAVDLDPFGTPAPFLDSAIRGTRRYLFITATDTAPLCGAHKKAGMRRYFASAQNNEYHAETALRILLGFAVRETVKYDRGIEPLFCFSKEHFVRLHIRINRGADAADRTLSRMGFVLQCPSCPFRTEEKGIIPGARNCPVCSEALVPIGPLWRGAIQDMEILGRMQALLPGKSLGTGKELSHLISTCSREPDSSSHYDYHRLAKYFRLSPPPMEKLLAGLENMGYAARRAHYSGTALKTDAPLEDIREVFLASGC